MRILFDIRLLGRGGTSGIEEYTRQLFTHLVALDQKNQYVLFYSGFKKEPLPQSWIEQPNVSVIDWHLPNRLLDASMRFLRTPAVDTATRTDLVISPHFNFLHTRRAPRIITFHDLSFIHHPDFFSRRQRFWHALQDYRRQAREAHHLIADSAFTKYDLVSSLGIPEEKITMIHPGVDAEFIALPVSDPRPAEFRTRHTLPFPFLLFLGTLEPRKNILTVIRAFNLLKQSPAMRDMRLVIAGQPGWLYRTILGEAARSPYHSHILFWGNVAHHDKLYLYNLAEAFVYPSFFEGFGFPPLEAQACGTPVVVSDRTSLPEVAGEGARFVNPWRVDELAERLKEILTNPSVHADLRTKGFVNAARFSWKRTAEKMFALISHVISQKNSY